MRRFPSRLRRCGRGWNIRRAWDGERGQDENGITAVVVTPFLDDAGKQRERPLAIVPAFSVMLEPGTQVISTHNGASTTVTVGVTSNLAAILAGQCCGWSCRRDGDRSRRRLAVKFTQRGEKNRMSSSRYSLLRLQEGRATIRAVLDCPIRRSREIQRGIHAGDARRSGEFLLLPAGAAAGEHGRCAGAA